MIVVLSMTSPFLSNQETSCAPLPFWDTVLREYKTSISPSRPAKGQYNETDSVAMRRRRDLKLLDPGAAALNQDDKHNDKQHARDNLDDRGTVHEIPLSELLASLCFLPEPKMPPIGGKQIGARFLARAPRLDEKGRHYNKENARDDLIRRCTVQLELSLPQWLNVVVNASNIMMAAGPRTTTKSAGKMKNTSGKISLMVVLAAASSTCWTRCVLSVSE